MYKIMHLLLESKERSIIHDLFIFLRSEVRYFCSLRLTKTTSFQLNTTDKSFKEITVHLHHVFTEPDSFFNIVLFTENLKNIKYKLNF